MISYNWKSRDFCVKLKDTLKKSGINVWIDIEQIQGSALQSMAEAVEDSQVVIICMTENYFQSPNCRLEAEYATKLNKTILPVLLQNQFQPLGWLGIILGSKIYYDFASSTFEEKFPSFYNEISVNYRKIEESNISDVSNSPINKNALDKLISGAITKPASSMIPSDPVASIRINAGSEERVKRWTTKEVNEWFNKINLRTNLNGVFEDIDGPCLLELNQIKTKTPDFFYTIIKDKLTQMKKLPNGEYEKYFKLSDLLRISLELSNLFSS